MAIELHHLNTHGMMESAGKVLDGVVRLKARIAELEEERRWRKFPDEKPKEDTWCIVFHDGEIDSDHYTRFAYNKKCDFAVYGYEVTHWMPLPSAPKEDK